MSNEKQGYAETYLYSCAEIAETLLHRKWNSVGNVIKNVGAGVAVLAMVPQIPLILGVSAYQNGKNYFTGDRYITGGRAKSHKEIAAQAKKDVKTNLERKGNYRERSINLK